MAYSYAKYTYDGTTTQFDLVSDDYISPNHIFVSVNGVDLLPSDWQWVHPTRIEIISPLVNPSTVLVYRSSSRNKRIVDYTAGSALVESDLDTDGNQSFYLAQEAFDAVVDTIKKPFGFDHWDAGGSVLRNVGTPIEPNDAVPKSYADDAVAVAEGHAILAGLDATSASDSAIAALGHANDAEASALAAATHASDAHGSYLDAVAALSGKSDLVHGHTIADVTNLQASLDAKVTQTTWTVHSTVKLRFNISANTNPPTIRESLNVSSITDFGVGIYRVVFSSLFTNTLFAVAHSASISGGAEGQITRNGDMGTNFTDVLAINIAGSHSDSAIVTGVVSGTLA